MSATAMSDEPNGDEKAGAADAMERSDEDTPSGQRGEDTNGHVIEGPALAATLLHTPIADDDRPGRRWAYYDGFTRLLGRFGSAARLLGRTLDTAIVVLTSAFILYHTAVLLVHNLPSKGLAKGLQKKFNEKLKADEYFRATGNTQSWAMFAPNPHRSNVFMRVFVKDSTGEVFDLQHDIYGRRPYPYLFYDRMGKINRRIIDQKGYRRHYAAWVCRWWEETHGGEPADEVQFVKLWTRVPPPEKVIQRFREKGYNPRYLGYNPMELELHQHEEDTFRCKSTRQAQLSNEMRRRLGLPETDETLYRPLSVRTWVDIKREKDERGETEEEKPEVEPVGGAD
jgi:hypothetical protein